MDDFECIECGCAITFEEFMEYDGLCYECYQEDMEDCDEGNIARFWNYHTTGSVCYLGTALGWYYKRGEEECRLAL